jgi:glycosyltransferase involved in cell wall biosynthesis
MYKGLRVAAVVPAHNEEQLIGSTIATMPDLVDLIVVVDDASTDQTAKRAIENGDPRVVLLNHEVNTGVGGSVTDGHQVALDEGADVCVVMAGDGQMDPAYLPALLDPIADEGYGYVKANRFYSRNALEGMPLSRLVGSVLLSFGTKLASGYWHLFDPQNGYTAISREALSRIDLSKVARGYSFENDMLIWLCIANVRAKDVPVPAVYGNEVSGMRMRKVIPELCRLLFAGFWRRIFLKYVLMSFSPIALMLFTGLVLIAGGAATGVWALVETPYRSAPTAGTVLLSVAPILVGVNMLVHALTLDIQQSPGQ